jgi:tetracycline 7-halogenase / FADH2 O2-dependent halogenase
VAADFDIAVIGSGFAGSLMAMIARRLGRSVVLIERGSHPRFAIGESSTPLANLLLERLARCYGLERLLPLTKWGPWQKAYPHLACGLKRGFTFYHHVAGRRFAGAADRSDQLLVEASGADAVADMHWYRADVDQFFVEEAQRQGVEYLDETELDRAQFTQDGAALEGTRRGRQIRIRATLLLDASGPAGFLRRQLKLPDAPLPGILGTQAIYSHFSDVRASADLAEFQCGQAPPYPTDSAAVHHVFAGGWIWMLRLNNGIVSAGAAVTDNLANDLALHEGEPAWRRLLGRFPSVGDLFASATPRGPFVHSPRLAFRSDPMAGDHWALLPSSAGFVDPLLSTGFPLVMLGIARLARAIEEDWDLPSFRQRLWEYRRQTIDELEAVARLVGALYRVMDDFSLFAGLSMLYFAAASYTESCLRQGKSARMYSYLLHDDPAFGPRLRACCQQVLDASPELRRSPSWKDGILDSIGRAIGPINIAGFADPARANWYTANIR